jgi:hypothetical protein
MEAAHHGVACRVARLGEIEHQGLSVLPFARRGKALDSRVQQA